MLYPTHKELFYQDEIKAPTEKPKVFLLSATFLHSLSSCSNKTPVGFEWTNDINQSNVVVATDAAIVEFTKPENQQQLLGKKKIWWLCESTAIINVMSDTLDYFSILRNHVDLVVTSDLGIISKYPNVHYCPNGSNIPWVPGGEQQIYPKTKNISMIASAKQMCPGHIVRAGVAKQAIETGKIDVFGGAAGSTRVGVDTSSWTTHIHPTKKDILFDYRYSIAMENAIYPTYFTEKVTDCFATGTIPIYWGDYNLCKYFNTKGIIFLQNFMSGDTVNFDKLLDACTPEYYEQNIDAVQENFERVQKLKMADDFLFEYYLKG